MVRTILVLSLVAMSAMSLAVPSAQAQTTPAGAAAPAASAIDPASIQALKDMGAFLQTLKRFRVSTELTGERVLADGQKLQHTATAVMDVERPNRLRVLSWRPGAASAAMAKVPFQCSPAVPSGPNRSMIPTSPPFHKPAPSHLAERTNKRS